MARLDKGRQEQLEPQRINFAVQQLQALGYDITHKDSTKVQFIHKGETVTLFPYSGWHSGKTIKDGRGLNNLLKQLSNGTDNK